MSLMEKDISYCDTNSAPNRGPPARREPPSQRETRVPSPFWAGSDARSVGRQVQPEVGHLTPGDPSDSEHFARDWAPRWVLSQL